jgi:hypothetical protein
MAAVKRRPAEEDNFEEPKAPVAPPSMEKQILNALGSPPNLYKVQVVNVGDQRWRANVRVHVQSDGTVQVSKIAHSFYIKTDDKGKITNLEVIEKTY